MLLIIYLFLVSNNF